MSTHDQATADNTQTSQPADQRKRGSSMGDKASGIVNVIHGTGEVIRGYALNTGDFGHGHGDGKAIAAAGREEVERGLNKIEGKHARTSSATDAPNGGGHHNGTGAAPARDTNAPQASATATRADPSVGKASGDAPGGAAYKETGTGTAGAVGGAVGGGPGSDQRTNANEQIAAPAPPARGDRPAGTDDPNVQRDTGGVASTTAPGDPGKQTRASTNLPLSGEKGGPRSDQRTDDSEQFTAFAPPGDRPAAADAGPNVRHGTGVESRSALGDTGKQTRPATNFPPSGGTAGQPEGPFSEMEARMEQPTQ